MIKLRSPNSSEEWKLDMIEFHEDSIGSYFSLRSSESNSLTFTINYPLPVDQAFKEKQFTCIPLTSPTKYRENNIFQVFIKPDKEKKRIGWIFPVQSLLSNEHSDATNPHFLRYAFVTFRQLVMGECFERDFYIELNSNNTELNIDDIYPTNLIVLSLSNETFQDLNGFDIANYFHSLYSNEYFYCPSSNEIIKSEISPPPLLTDLYLKRLSKELEDDFFIKALFKDYLRKNSHPLAQFSLLYQVIELMIAKIYNCEIDKLVAESRVTPMLPRDLRKAFENLSETGPRITKLFEEYLDGSYKSTTELIELIKIFLNHFDLLIEEEKEIHISKAIYNLRNKIVHEFRSIAEKERDFDLLKSINKHFSILIADVLSLFSTKFVLPQNENQIPLVWLQYKLLEEQDSISSKGNK